MIFKAIGQLPSLYLAKRKRKEIEKDITNKTLHRVLKHEVITLSVDIKHLSNLFTLQEIFMDGVSSFIWVASSNSESRE